MALDINGNLNLDHNRTSTSNNTNAREIGNRLLTLHLIEISIKLASKIAFLAAIVWTVQTIVEHIDKTAELGDCGSKSRTLNR